MTGVPMDAVTVWNLDARYRPELEVEIDIICPPDEIPGWHHASMHPELEVEIAMTPPAMTNAIDDLFANAWFVEDDVLALVS